MVKDGGGCMLHDVLSSLGGEASFSVRAAGGV